MGAPDCRDCVPTARRRLRRRYRKSRKASTSSRKKKNRMPRTMPTIWSEESPDGGTGFGVDDGDAVEVGLFVLVVEAFEGNRPEDVLEVSIPELEPVAAEGGAVPGVPVELSETPTLLLEVAAELEAELRVPPGVTDVALEA
jgi:hypothetical protein